MAWFDEVANKINRDQLQVINDSKTPSGRVHVGALRGVLIHDVIFRVLGNLQIPARYLFGVDDYDPLDEIPAGQAEYFTKYLGAPLCNVPAPPDSDAPNVAEYFIKEFFDVFSELGAHAEQYRTSDIYRSGTFNEAIDAILRNASVVRQVYKKISNSERPDTWFPFQVICERCGRIGTTQVIAYDGKEVDYICRPDMVSWAVGCGSRGKISPFDGHGKLPWKLEWVAKWKTFGVSIEGAGKDHTTRGGSRDVAAACLREIFGQEPPLNIPYEFFLVGGAKMSSSRGVGASAREVADFLPPEVLRFLVLRTHPNRPVNFSLNEEFIIKLFNDFDRYRWRAFNDPEIREEEKQVYFLSEVTPEGDYFAPGFQLVTTLAQMPHINLREEVEKRKNAPLTEIEIRHLNHRIKAAQYWLENYAEESQKIRLQDSLPEGARQLTATQRAFLYKLASNLPFTAWEDDSLQSEIFNVARLTPVSSSAAFQAIYRVLLDRESGPKAGSLLSVLDKKFVVERFRESPYSIADFWRETSVTPEEFEEWLFNERSQINSANIFLDLLAVEIDSPLETLGNRLMAGIGVIECVITFNDSKTHMKRISFNRFKGFDLSFEQESDDFRTRGTEYIQGLGQKHNISITVGGSRSLRESLVGHMLDKEKRNIFLSEHG